MGSVLNISENVMFGERDIERVSGVSIKQRGSADRFVADRQLLLYNFNNSVVAF